MKSMAAVQNKNILLIEDNEADELLILHALRESETQFFQLTCRKTLQAALDEFSTQDFDLILLDLHLPDYRGLDMIPMLQEKANNTPVIILTGQILGDEQLEAIQRGADDYIVKDHINEGRLVRSIHYALERHEMKKRRDQMFGEVENQKLFFENLLEIHKDAILLVDATGKITYANASAASLMGQPLEQLRGSYFQMALKSDQDVEVEFESNGVKKIAEMKSVKTHWRKNDETTEMHLCMLRDITLRKTTEQSLIELTAELEKQVLLDPLTGVFNRRGFEQQFLHEQNFARRHDVELYGVLVDLDNFKQINDKFSHAVGDVVLKEVAYRIKAVARPIDSIARIGGDEFVILLSQLKYDDALRVAERIRLSICNNEIILSAQQLKITMSAALIKIPPSVTTIEALLIEADPYLQESKKRGKNRVITDRSVLASNQWYEAELLQAFDSFRYGRDIVVLRQPIVDLQTGNEIGYEFLTRSRVKNFETPDLFFNFCMEKNILNLIDMHCFRRCCELSRDILADQTKKIHINLFQSTILSTQIEEFLEIIPSERIRNQYCIEISEQQIIGNPECMIESIQRFKEKDFLIAIDDVGFGRSCLESMIILKPDIVKIDKRCVTGVAHDLAKKRTLKNLIRVLKAVTPQIIAEGIETEDDAKVLLELDIRYGQGYYYAKPY
ncbi:MAG: diguanylate cyclase [Candidatus Omnitrophica bacterium]|nr:diguanylate cyclase [Candidatus Omnitrophota bacterium]